MVYYSVGALALLLSCTITPEKGLAFHPKPSLVHYNAVPISSWSSSSATCLGKSLNIQENRQMCTQMKASSWVSPPGSTPPSNPSEDEFRQIYNWQNAKQAAQEQEEDDQISSEMDVLRRGDDGMTYEVTLPMPDKAQERGIGVTLRQAAMGGRMSNYVLDLDSMAYMDVDVATAERKQQQQQQQQKQTKSENSSATLLGPPPTMFLGGERNSNFAGILVESVCEDGLAWEEGVRPGDILEATSATLGKKLWPKSTLEGVRSALSSRNVMSNTMTFRFRRSKELIASTEVVETFELPLSRPIGIIVEETEQGQVEITGFVKDRPLTEAEKALRIGDRIVAVDSSIGRKMWPISNVEGLVSAVTSRLPGKSVNLRFERVVNVGAWTTTKGGGASSDVMELDTSSATTTSTTSTTTSTSENTSVDGMTYAYEDFGMTEQELDSVVPALAGAVDGFRRLNEDTSSVATTEQTTEQQQQQQKSSSVAIPLAGSNTHKLLLARCRDVLRRYGVLSASASLEDDKILGAYTAKSTSAAAAMAADRVLEALADASAPLDALTLSMIMSTYSQCGKPEKAMRAFEAAVGLCADGSANTPKRNVIVGRKDSSRTIPTDLAALNVYTASALLRAHALSGDVASALRVLAVMEGQQPRQFPELEENEDDIHVKPWPVHIAADVRCYNICLAAAAVAGGEGNLKVAVDIFEEMPDTLNALDVASKNWGRSNGESMVMRRPWKNLVTYNTMMNAFAAQVGHSQDAYTVFYSMQQAGVKPDKITYTTLIKSLVADGDMNGARDLLKEMKAAGIDADTLTYNTVIKGLCQRLRWYEAKLLASEMESSGIPPNAVTYGHLMHGLLKAGKPEACLTLFEAACSDASTTALTEYVQLYTTAMTAASMVGDHDRALELVARMRTIGLKPNLKTLTALMSACLSSKRPDTAVKVFEQLQQAVERNEMKMDGKALTTGLKSYCDNGDYNAASELLTTQSDGYQEMSGKEIMMSYNYLLKSSLSAGDYQVARATMTNLLDGGYIPSKKLLKGILEGLGLVGKRRSRNASQLMNNETPVDTQKFDYMLFLIDALNGRQLPCDVPLYVATLFEGARIGGSRKVVASLMTRARKNEGSTTKSDGKWEDLAKRPTWDVIKDEELWSSPPMVRVRFTDKDIRLGLAAERAVSMKPKKRRRSSVVKKNVSVEKVSAVPAEL